MPYHNKDIVDELAGVMRDAFTLYYDFKILLKLSDDQRREFKAYIECALELSDDQRREFQAILARAMKEVEQGEEEGLDGKKE